MISNLFQLYLLGTWPRIMVGATAKVALSHLGDVRLAHSQQQPTGFNMNVAGARVGKR